MTPALQLWTTWLLIGLILGIAFVAIARWLGERRIFSVGLIVVALVYVGFAIVNDADWSLIGIEALGIPFYGCFAVLGLRYTHWWLAVGWAAHPLWDVGLHVLGEGTSLVPLWYPIQCVSFDLVVALYIAFQCWRRSPEQSRR